MDVVDKYKCDDLKLNVWTEVLSKLALTGDDIPSQICTAVVEIAIAGGCWSSNPVERDFAALKLRVGLRRTRLCTVGLSKEDFIKNHGPEAQDQENVVKFLNRGVRVWHGAKRRRLLGATGGRVPGRKLSYADKLTRELQRGRGDLQSGDSVDDSDSGSDKDSGDDGESGEHGDSGEDDDSEGDGDSEDDEDSADDGDSEGDGGSEDDGDSEDDESSSGEDEDSGGEVDTRSTQAAKRRRTVY